MADWQHCQQAPGEEKSGLQPWLGGARDCSVQFAAHYRLHRMLAALLAKLQFNVRTGVAVPGDEGDDHALHDHRRAAYEQQTSIAFREGSRALVERLSPSKQIVATYEKIMAVLRQPHTPAGALEQAQTES